MNKKIKILSIIMILSTVFYLTFPALSARVETTQAANAVTKTNIRVNGLSADTFLVEETTNTYGFLNVGRDQIANTTSLDFSYATPDINDPQIVYLIHGAGEIPNSAFTISSATAHLSVTTSFPVRHCAVNIVTADYNCETGTPITFDLIWVKNGFGSIDEKVHRTETIGPLTVKFKGEFESVTAIVNGSWTEHSTAGDLSGNRVDSKDSTNIREITLKANP